LAIEQYPNDIYKIIKEIIVKEFDSIDKKYKVTSVKVETV
jgi:hypothetical protein